MSLGAITMLLALSMVGANESDRSSCSAVEYKMVKPPRYPPEAVRDHSEGKAILLITVGTDGVPRNIVVSTSSGNLYLDNAATETVRDWRFKPKYCAGEAVASQISIPVDFTLADEGADSKLPSASKWDVAPDNQVMEFSSTSSALKYLTTKTGIAELPSNNPGHRTFHQESSASAKIWFVDTAASTGWTTVVRWRQVERDGTRWGLYAYLCDGPEAYCTEMRTSIVEFTRAHPPPPPPLQRSTQ